MATSTGSTNPDHADNNTSYDESDERKELDRLFGNKGREKDIAHSLVDAKKRERWPFLKKLVDRIFSADLSEKVDSELKKNDKNPSLQKLACDAKLGVFETDGKNLTENLILDFLSSVTGINESNHPHEYEDIRELAAAADRNEHFREIWSKIQFVKPDDEDQRVDQSKTKDKLKEKLEVLAKDKLRSDPFFMSLEWFRDCWESELNIAQRNQHRLETTTEKSSQISKEPDRTAEVSAQDNSEEPSQSADEKTSLLSSSEHGASYRALPQDGHKNENALDSDNLQMTSSGQWKSAAPKERQIAKVQTDKSDTSLTLSQERYINEDVLVKAL